MTGPQLEQTRPFLEAEIERLMEILDTLDPDPDLEDTADGEPWLGAPNARTGSWSGLYLEGNDDREEDDCDSEDGGDDEPSLGSSNSFAGSWESRRVASPAALKEEHCRVTSNKPAPERIDFALGPHLAIKSEEMLAKLRFS